MSMPRLGGAITARKAHSHWGEHRGSSSWARRRGHSHWWTYFQVYFRLTNKVGNTDLGCFTRDYLLYYLRFANNRANNEQIIEQIEQIQTNGTVGIRISNFISESEIHLEIRPPVQTALEAPAVDTYALL